MMDDSPLKKRIWETGICWEYMENGRCHCPQKTFGSHPKITVEAAAANNNTTTTGGSDSGTVVIVPQRIFGWITYLGHLGFIEGDMHNFATLQTTYEERNAVKALGADYAAGMKKWIVAPMKDLRPFAKWKPKVHNRGENDVVFHNTNFDRKSAVAALLRSGFYIAHINVVGDDDEAKALRKELNPKFHLVIRQGGDDVKGGTKSQQQGLSNHSSADGDVSGGKRRTLNFGDDVVAAAAATTPSQSSKRPCFSGPESMQTFVRMSQEKQMGGQHAVEGKGKTTEGSSSISSLLITAKSAMVNCLSDGSISQQQKDFNKAIYGVVEAIAAAEMVESRDMTTGSVVAHVTPARNTASK